MHGNELHLFTGKSFIFFSLIVLSARHSSSGSLVCDSDSNPTVIRHTNSNVAGLSNVQYLNQGGRGSLGIYINLSVIDPWFETPKQDVVKVPKVKEKKREGNYIIAMKGTKSFEFIYLIIFSDMKCFVEI